MIQGINNFIKKFYSMKLNKKIILSVFSISLMINLFTIISISILAGNEITNKSSKLIEGQFEVVNNLLVNKLNDVSELALLITSNSTIKDYLMYDLKTNDKYRKITSDTYDLIRYVSDSKSFIDYISLVKFNDSELIYVGETWTNSNFRERIINEFYNSYPMDLYNFKVSISKKIFYSNENVINIYIPVENKYFRKDYLGFLVIGIGIDSFNEFYTKINGDNKITQFIIDSKGIIISHNNVDMIGETSNLQYDFNNNHGELKNGKDIIIYRKIDQWNWYIVSEVPRIFLFKDTYITLLFIISIFILIGFIGILLLYKLSNKLYEPIDVIVTAMEEVSKGNLNIRVENKYDGTDFKQMTRYFNIMVEEINLLMEKVKNEEKQVKQIELNRLQSQIKPHFLYNTLECIHWQALADGSKNASKMVKALASFYRVSLSSGRELIMLSEEITLIKNYLIIQNMRYSDIVLLNIDINEDMNEILIPKMTLQPLVENSIYHGIKVKAGLKGEIFISSRVNENKVILSLSDTGIGMPQRKIDDINSSISIFEENNGYGLKNVNKRIEMTFGDEYGLYYRINERGQTTVDIILPRGVENV